jgi:hypothetical protein
METMRPPHEVDNYRSRGGWWVVGGPAKWERDNENGMISKIRDGHDGDSPSDTAVAADFETSGGKKRKTTSGYGKVIISAPPVVVAIMSVRRTVKGKGN